MISRLALSRPLATSGMPATVVATTAAIGISANGSANRSGTKASCTGLVNPTCVSIRIRIATTNVTKHARAGRAVNEPGDASARAPPRRRRTRRRGSFRNALARRHRRARPAQRFGEGGCSSGVGWSSIPGISALCGEIFYGRRKLRAKLRGRLRWAVCRAATRRRRSPRRAARVR